MKEAKHWPYSGSLLNCFEVLKFYSVLQAHSLFPSVRCGLEMAILGAVAARCGSSFLNILCPLRETVEHLPKSAADVKICALIDSTGNHMEVARTASSLVAEGFTAIKLKVRKSHIMMLRQYILLGLLKILQSLGLEDTLE